MMAAFCLRVSRKAASVVNVLVLLDLARIGTRLSRAHRIVVKRGALAADQNRQNKRTRKHLHCPLLSAVQ